MRRQHRLKLLSILLVAALLSVVVAGGLALAQGTPPTPQLPQSFWGSVKDASGNPISSGTVEAWLGGVKHSAVTIVNGQYGDPTWSDSDRILYVSGTSEDIGKTVEFYVNGVKARETASYNPGQITKLDLTVSAAPPPPPDTTPPVISAFTINNGAEATNKREVTLRLEASDDRTPPSGLQMRLSNDGQSWSSWEPYASTKSWTLSPGEGQKTVYVQVKDQAGNPATDHANIILDTTAPTAPANLRVTAKTSSSVTLAWDACTDNHRVAKYIIEMKQTGGDFQVAGESTTNAFTKSGLASSTTYVFRVKAVDAATNESGWSNEATVTTEAAAGGGGGGGGALPPADKVEKPIQPGTTTVAELSGKVKVEVPPGAVTGTGATITAEVAKDEKASGAGMLLISKVVDITLKNGTLTGKITIILYFDKNKLGKDQEPVAFYYDEKAGKWVRLDGTVDPDKGTITVVVDHLTLFAVFAVAKEVPKPPAKPTFLDMAGHWAEETVSELAYRGIISGYPDGTFRPENSISRAEIASILTGALKLAPGSDQDLKFKDNATIPAWARSAVAAAVREGLVKGYPQRDGTVTFEAKRSLSRTEMACLVARVIEGKLGAITPAELTFADAAKIPAWARPSIGTAVAQGIISGYPDGTFRGEKPVTRAEAVAMVARLLQVIGQE